MTKVIGKIMFILIIFTLILVGLSTIIKAEDEKFSLDKTKLDIPLNSSRLLSYSNKPIGESITWKSDNKDIASVDEYGSVTGVSIGTTKITATVGDQVATCDVSVVYSDITIKGNDGLITSSINLVLKEHPSENLTATVRDGQYEDVSNATITWESSNSNVATVDNTGKVKAVSVGKTNITASAAGVSTTREVNVVAAPKFTDFTRF